MVNYPNNNYKVEYLNNDERFFPFVVPFLGGALVGSAAVGLTRPRPIYNVAPQNYGPQFNPGMPYGNYSYSYYYPTYRPY